MNPPPPEPGPTPTVPDFGLSVDPWGRLVLRDAEGREHVGVEPVRLFPLSEPTRWLAFCDPRGREVLAIEDPSALPPELRRVLDAELSWREFQPIIRRIVRVSSPTLPADWDVETDRGPISLRLDGEDHVRVLGPHRMLLTDTTGLRYLVPDIRKLDTPGRRLLERFL
jgi:hypothetical protein